MQLIIALYNHFYLYLLWLSFCCRVAGVVSAGNNNKLRRLLSASVVHVENNVDDDDSSSVLCRILKISTMMETTTEEDGDMYEEEEIACIPILDEQETDHLIPIRLPDNMAQTDRQRLFLGKVLLEITNAVLLLSPRSSIATTVDSQYLLRPINDENNEKYRQRDLQKKEDYTHGVNQVAIVRISTNDSTPSITADQLRQLFDANNIHFPSQYHKCSFGQLEWKLAEVGVIDVYINQSVTEFGPGSGDIVGAAQQKVREVTQVMNIERLAHRILFCAPPGTGNWVASAGLGHWRAQFNDPWCLSLTATMHELGHTIGLLHANENGSAYEDTTGNMAKSYRTVDSPQRCFDGRSHHVLGWYANRELQYDPTTDYVPRLVDVAAFVDYDKTTSEEVVLVTLPGDIFIQYNRAKSFNVGTGEKRDMITITTMNDSGSNLVAGLALGDRYSFDDYQGTGARLLIEACQVVAGNDTHADKITISVGMRYSVCTNFFGVGFALAAGQSNGTAGAQTEPTQAPVAIPINITAFYGLYNWLHHPKIHPSQNTTVN